MQWVRENQALRNIILKVLDLVKGTEPAPLVKGLTAEGNPLVFTKTPPPLPASIVGEKIGGELLLGRAILETAEGAKVDESLATALTEIKRISATGAEFARRAQDALIVRVPQAFATAAGAQAATVTDAERVLSELMKIKHWRQVLVNKNVLVVLTEGKTWPSWAARREFFGDTTLWRSQWLIYRKSDIAVLGSFDIARTLEKHRTPHPLVISQRFYQYCLKQKILLEVEPVRIYPE